MKKKYFIVGLSLTLLGIVATVFGILTGKKGPLFVGNVVLSSILLALSFILFLVGFSFIMHSRREMKIKELVLISIQAAITILLYHYAKFKLPFVPSWLDFQVSEIPAIITSFIYGPIAGILIIVLRFVIKVPFTITVGVGELADLILGIIIVLITGLIYKKNRTLKGAIISSVIAIFAGTVMAAFLNWLVLIPAYLNIAGFPEEALISGMSYIDGINSQNFMKYYIFVGIIPFNLVRYLIVFILTFVLYKNTHRIFERFVG